MHVVSGDHTRSIQIATPTVGGLMKFAVKTVTCLGCKTPLKANNSVKSMCCVSYCAYSGALTMCYEQMAQYATTADRDWENCTRSRLLRRPTSRSGSRASGRSANGVKDHCTKYVLRFNPCMMLMIRRVRTSFVRVATALYST